MFGFILITMASASLARAQGGEVIVPPDNKTQCISQMVQWCDGMQYPQEGVGMSMLSVTFQDTTGYYRAFCVSDIDGTNCTRNGMPWFTCSPNHTLTYKGTPLTNASTGVDDDICVTADRAFNDLFVQNLSYNTSSLETGFEKGLESFFEQMAAMQEEIEQLQKILMRIPIFDPSFWGGTGDWDTDSTTITSTTTSTASPTTDQSNQIEKE